MPTLRPTLKFLEEIGGLVLSPPPALATQLAKLNEEEARERQIRALLADYVREFSEAELHASAARRHRKRQLIDQQELAARTVTALHLPGFLAAHPTIIKHHRALLVDTCLLVFHNA